VSTSLTTKGQRAPHRGFNVAVCSAAVALTLAGCGGDSGGGGAKSAAKLCADGNAVMATLQSRVDSNLAPLGKSELTGLAAKLRKLAAEAPAQIKADLTTDAAYFEKASVNGIGAVDSAITTAAQAAGERLGTWGDQNCGSGSTSSGASPTSAAASSATTSAPDAVSASAAADVSAFCADRQAVLRAIASLAAHIKAGQTPSTQELQQDVTDTARLADEAPSDASIASVPRPLKNDATKLSNDVASLANGDSTVSPTGIDYDVAAVNFDGIVDCRSQSNSNGTSPTSAAPSNFSTSNG